MSQTRLAVDIGLWVIILSKSRSMASNIRFGVGCPQAICERSPRPKATISALIADSLAAHVIEVALPVIRWVQQEIRRTTGRPARSNMHFSSIAAPLVAVKAVHSAVLHARAEPFRKIAWNGFRISGRPCAIRYCFTEIPAAYIDNSVIVEVDRIDDLIL